MSSETGAIRTPGAQLSHRGASEVTSAWDSHEESEGDHTTLSSVASTSHPFLGGLQPASVFHTFCHAWGKQQDNRRTLEDRTVMRIKPLDLGSPKGARTFCHNIESAGKKFSVTSYLDQVGLWRAVLTVK